MNGCTPPSTLSASSTLKGMAESLKHDETMKELHDAVEKALVRRVCWWIHAVLSYAPGAGALILYVNGKDIYVNPLLVSAFGMGTSLLFRGQGQVQATAAASVGCIALFIVRHALSQGCSASLVPAIYGFLPCAVGFLFRTTRAVVLSTVSVLLATLFIFAVDLTGHCTSDPIRPTEVGYKVADRLFPMLVLILGNASVLVCSVRQSEESLALHARAARSAARLAAVRRDVLHRVAHELRTPLNGMVGCVELLAASDDLGGHDMENVLTVRSCLRTIVNICDNVLVAAKVAANDAPEEGRRRLEEERRRKRETAFDVASCLETVAEIFGAMAELKGVQLRVEYVGRHMQTKVLGMELELRQVLFNLVGNALKFTEVGSITVRVREEENCGVDVLPCCPELSGSDVLRYTFEVQDTGIGVDPRTSDMLFEAFHQGEQGGAVSRRHKGTGLGLTICRDLVKSMGGEISVDGVPRHGSRFFFALPFRKAEVEPVPSRSLSNNRNQGSGGKTCSGSHPPCRIIIADSQTESSTSCRSVVESLAPHSEIRNLSCPMALIDVMSSERDDRAASSADIRRIAFVEFDSSTDASSIESMLSKLKKYGWLVLAYGDHDTFPHLVSRSSDAYATFRRPLHLVRLCAKFRDALAGRSPPTQPRNARRSSMLASVESLRGEAVVPVEEPNSRRRRFSRRGSALFSRDGECSDVSSTGIGSHNEKAMDIVSANSSSLEGTTGPKTINQHIRPDSSKLVVVDDTPLNVKVLTKMLSRSTSLPIVSLFDGLSVVEYVACSNRDDTLLILMDWHMPGVCGLTAAESIRRISARRGGPTVVIFMVTADGDGLRDEMDRRGIRCRGKITMGEFRRDSDASDSTLTCTSESEDDISSDATWSCHMEGANHSKELAVVDVLVEKPVTLRSTQAILTWFCEETKMPQPCRTEKSPRSSPVA